MSLLKLLVWLTLVTAAVVHADDDIENPEYSKDLKVGERQAEEKLVCRKEVKISASLMGFIINYRWEYKVPQGLEISRISAINQAGNDSHGHEANVALVSKGPIKDHAALLFHSRKFHGIYFTIELYSKSVSDDASFCLVEVTENEFLFLP